MNIGSSLSSQRSRFSLKGNKRLRAIGSVSSVLFTVLLLATIVPVYYEPTNTEALTGNPVESVLTFSSINPAASVNLTVNSPDGTFATSTDGTNNTLDQRASFSIATNNYTGYTVSISSTNVSGELDHQTDSIDTIPSIVTATEFANNSKSGTDLNNTWGYIPNYYDSVINTTNYYPSSTTAATLNSTSAPNSVTGTTNPDTYTIGLGIRADYATQSGTYKNSTIVVSYIANPVGYTINYDPNDGNDGADVSNMPNPNPQVGTEVSTTINLDNSTPTHSNDMYTFKGWCSVEPASTLSEDCTDSSSNTGIIYQPGDTYGIDKTAANVTTLYALWERPHCNTSATTIGTNTKSTDAVCMQDINDDVITSMVTHTQYKLYDNRDWKVYYVAKMNDGRVWMTKNLDLDLESTPNKVAQLNSRNTNLTTYGSQNYTTAKGYSCVNTEDSNATVSDDCTSVDEMIVWTPVSATLPNSRYGSWENYLEVPVSWDGGDDVYYYTSGTTSNDIQYTMTQCLAANHTEEECSHYHVGNYYNWSAAVATNSTSSITANYTKMNNSICPAGWRLPHGRTSNTATDVGYYGELNYTWIYEGVATSWVILAGGTGATYKTTNNISGFNVIRTAPLYMVRAGYRDSAGVGVYARGTYGGYWTNSVHNGYYAYKAVFTIDYLYPINSITSYGSSRGVGNPVRCVAMKSSYSGKTTISFDKNAEDATGTMAGQDINANTWGTLNSNAYTREGYGFGTWNTKADGTGDSYANAGQFYAIASDEIINTTLYAIWSRNQTITFDKNAADATCAGSNCVDSATMNTQTIAGNSSANLLANGYSRPGYTFLKWNTISSGSGASYNNSASYTVPPDNELAGMTLYAQWGLNQTVTFDKNAADATCTGSTCMDAATMNTQTFNAGASSVALLANGYTRPGYLFGGWMNSADGTSSNYNDKASYSVAATNTIATKTLYARWIPAVTFAAGTGVNTIIVTDGNQNYKPLYATAGNPVSIQRSTKRVIITVVPEAGYKLSGWSSDLSSGETTFTNDTLLTTTISAFSSSATPETLTATGTTGSYTTMQSLDESTCPATTAATPTGINVTDSRDNKSYTVAKINGHCYMMSDLRLDNTMDDGNGGTTARVLTSTDSDITPNDTYSQFTMPTASWSDYRGSARMRIENGQYYYNWYAAKANQYSTTGTPTEANDNLALGSICPKGWTLPDYDSDITGGTVWTSSTNVGMLSTSGRFLSGSQVYVGSSGVWWSSARYYNNYAYLLYFSGSSAGRGNYDKYSGGKASGAPYAVCVVVPSLVFQGRTLRALYKARSPTAEKHVPQTSGDSIE